MAMKGMTKINLVKTSYNISSYFYKTHIQWNNLPLEVKIIEDYEQFQAKLEQHLWDFLVKPDKPIDSSFQIPGEWGD